MKRTRPVDAGILRRHFVAIATGEYEALPPLPVLGEVETLANWFCGEDLGERHFIHEYPELAANPTVRQIRDALQEPPANLKWREADAAVVFITGHGMSADQEHWLMLAETSESTLWRNGLRTAEIVGWLAETGIEHLLLIIDTCYAGDVAGGVVRFDRPLPDTWLVLASAAKDQRAMAGALTGAIQQVLAEFGGVAGRKYGRKYLTVEKFCAAVQEKLDRAQRLVLVQGSQTSGRHPCLPNPQYKPSASMPISPQLSDLALPKTDLEVHWGPDSDRDSGWLFAGRARLTRALIEAAAGKPGAVLVTGAAGSGKSAALARLVTLSDPEFRDQYAAQVARVPAELLPAEESVDVAVRATGKNSTEIMIQVCRAVGAVGEEVLEPSLDEARAAWQTWLANDESWITIVIDAVDEATGTADDLIDMLRRIADVESATPRVTLLLGVRSVGVRDRGDAMLSAGETPQELAARLRLELPGGEDRPVRQVQVDEEPLWEPGDVAGYAESLLRFSPDSPYRDAGAATVRKIAEVIAGAAGKSFLIAKLAAAPLASGAVADVSDPAWQASINEGVFGPFREDLRRIVPDPADRLRAVHLLRAVAFAFGPGLPWGDIWPLVANEVADAPDRYGDEDIDWLLSTRLSGYLVTDRADGAVVYRLFHDELRQILYERWAELLTP